MYCYNCGKEISDSAVFCKWCGTKCEKITEADQVADCVKRLKNGDAAAFSELYELTQKYVRYVARLTVKDKAEVDDIVQEVYLAVYNKMDTLNDPNKAFGWIKTITHNIAINAINKNAKYVLVSEDGEDRLENIEETDVMMIPENAIEEKYFRNLIAEMIDKLPTKQGIIILEYYYNNKKISEISEEYNISQGTVKSNLSKARKNIQTKIFEYQKKTGIRLHSIPLLPFMYVVIKESIQNTAIESMPKAVSLLIGDAIGSTSADTTTGIKASSTVKAKTMDTVGKIAGIRTVVIKVAVGISITAAVGTGVSVYNNGNKYDTGEIYTLVEEFEDACKNLDNDKLLDCLSTESFDALEDTDLTSEYVQVGEDTKKIGDQTDFSLKVGNVQFEGNEAYAYCVYTQMEDGKGTSTYDGYLGFVYEKHEWKIQLSRDSRSIFKAGNITWNYRFPELIINEMVFHDEIE